MNPHPRIKKTVKWGGAVVCIVLSGVWISSAWFYVAWWSASGNAISVANGGIKALHEASPVNFQGLYFGYTRAPFHWWFSAWTWGSERMLFIPIWVFVAITAGLTATAWRLDTLAQHRTRLNHCPTCNYDRRGLPAASPCPECGAVPVSSAQTVT